MQGRLQRRRDGVALAARSEVDRSYARCLRVLLDGAGYPMLATHDPRLIAIAEVAGRHDRPRRGQLRVPDALRHQARRAAPAGAEGAQVRVYVPYGNDWYGYLVRRLAERPANLAFFLRALATRR